MLKGIRRSWGEAKSFVSGLAPLWALLFLVLFAALFTWLLQSLFQSRFSWATFLAGWGSINEIAGVFFLFKEVWSAHKEVGAPSPLQAGIARLKQIVYVFKNRPLVHTQLSGEAGFYTFTGSRASFHAAAVTIEGRVEKLENELKNLESSVGKHQDSVEQRFKSTLESIKQQASVVESLKLHLSEELKKTATGPTKDKLSGAVLVIIGLVLNQLSSFAST